MASVNDSHCRCTSVLVLCSSETLDPVMTSIASEQIASIFHQSIQNTGANDLPYEGMSKQVTRGVTSLLAGMCEQRAFASDSITYYRFLPLKRNKKSGTNALESAFLEASILAIHS